MFSTIKRIFHATKLLAVVNPMRVTAPSVMALLWVAVSGTAHAALIDPNFAVCGTSSITTSCGADPNQISGSGSLYSGVIGNAGGPSGAGPLNPYLFLVAAPSQNGGQVGGPSFSLGSSVFSGTNVGAVVTVSAATTAQYMQTTAVQSGGYLGQFTSSSPDLYTFAGLAGGNASMNWSNFLKGSTAGGGSVTEAGLLGWTPQSFSIYEFTVDVSGVIGNLDNSNIYKILYSSIPLGSYVAAWGIDACSQSSTNEHTGKITYCSDGQFVYDSPFTTAGWVNSSSSSSSTSGGASSGGPLPEPATLSLLGLGLAGLAASRRRLKV